MCKAVPVLNPLGKPCTAEPHPSAVGGNSLYFTRHILGKAHLRISISQTEEIRVAGKGLDLRPAFWVGLHHSYGVYIIYLVYSGKTERSLVTRVNRSHGFSFVNLAKPSKVNIVDNLTPEEQLRQFHQTRL